MIIFSCSTIVANVTSFLRHIAQSCWATKSSERPMFSAICDTALFCDVPTAAMSAPATDGPRANLASSTAGEESELTHIPSLGDTKV